MVSKTIVRLNNSVLRLRSPKCLPRELLILIPSCLQSSKCKEKVTIDILNCRRCGGCPVGEIVKVGEEYGVAVACATGGRLALSIVRGDDVRVIVAVACEKELRAGIIGAFPKPVSAIANVRPHGPCRDTGVDVAQVRAEVARFLGRRKAPRRK
jgi:hypothetical protein